MIDIDAVTVWNDLSRLALLVMLGKVCFGTLLRPSWLWVADAARLETHLLYSKNISRRDVSSSGSTISFKMVVMSMFVASDTSRISFKILEACFAI